MSTAALFYLEVDATGALAANAITGETHTCPARTMRVFAPDYGHYYADTLVVQSTNALGAQRTLTRGTDYLCVEFAVALTQQTGLEVCAAILVLDQTLPDQFTIAYQAYGGAQRASAPVLLQMLETLRQDAPAVSWGDLLDKPRRFAPNAHPTDCLDLYGLETLRDAVTQLTPAIQAGSAVYKARLHTAWQEGKGSVVSTLAQVALTLDAHLDERGNPHQLTRAQAGLDALENRAFVRAFANDTFIEPYASPQTAAVTNAQTLRPLSAEHLALSANPHDDTAEQAGLMHLRNLPVGGLLTPAMLGAALAPSIAALPMTARPATFDLAAGTMQEFDLHALVPAPHTPAEFELRASAWTLWVLDTVTTSETTGRWVLPGARAKCALRASRYVQVHSAHSATLRCVLRIVFAPV